MSTVQPPTHPCRRLTRARRPLLLAALLLAATRAAAAAPAPDFYDPDAVRVLRLDFADADWESRLPTLPEGQHLLADLDFEGEALSGVGVGLKGNSSSRAPGRKKPLNLTIDATVKGQRLMAYDVVNLNNGFADPSLVRETLVSGLVRPFLPMPRAGYVHLDIGGGYWGAFTSIQQIEGTFIKQWFPTSDGILFKGVLPEGRPCRGGGLGASGAGGWLGAGGAGLEGRGSGERQGPGGARRPEVGRGVWEAGLGAGPGAGAGGFGRRCGGWERIWRPIGRLMS
ncbi:MAG: CotH kinase family protein [Ardenticatenia bacterium]|nr:CotH kinase family protein [Ardenticatenia bacterium]